MNGSSAPVVLTAGVGRDFNTANKSAKRNGKQSHVRKNENKTVDEETGANIISTPASGSLHTNEKGESNNTFNAADRGGEIDRKRQEMIQEASVKLDDLYSAPPVIDTEVEVAKNKSSDFFWLAFCFFGIMGSFVCYGLLLEYATSGGKHLHELSFLFVTSLLYTLTASAGRYIRAEEQSTIPPAQFFVLGLTSMGSTFCSVRALRYVIYPIQVLAKSCKPVPVMLMGALMGKKYPAKKYLKVALIVGGVGLFMGGG